MKRQFYPSATFRGLRHVPFIAISRNSLYPALEMDEEAIFIGVVRRHALPLSEIAMVDAAGTGKRLGIVGFGAAAHIITQLAVADGRQVYAMTRAGDANSQQFARDLAARVAAAAQGRPCCLRRHPHVGHN
jgi:hypothetical protein